MGLLFHASARSRQTVTDEAGGAAGAARADETDEAIRPAGLAAGRAVVLVKAAGAVDNEARMLRWVGGQLWC